MKSLISFSYLLIVFSFIFSLIFNSYKQELTYSLKIIDNEKHIQKNKFRKNIKEENLS